MIPNLDLAEIRERAHSNGLGRNLVDNCTQAISDRRTLLDLVDTIQEDHEIVQGMLRVAITQLAKVRELHRDDGRGNCEVCMDFVSQGTYDSAYYPCPTIKALDGPDPHVSYLDTN